MTQDKLREALQTILEGVRVGHIKSKPLMPPIDDDAESIDPISLETFIEKALSGPAGRADREPDNHG